MTRMLRWLEEHGGSLAITLISLIGLWLALLGMGAATLNAYLWAQEKLAQSETCIKTCNYKAEHP